MKIASWNVNSLNVRLPHVLQWLELQQPDILALQETKLRDEKFPCAAITAAGYHVIYSGQPTYNGVAILSRDKPTEVANNLISFPDAQQRVLSASISELRIINVTQYNQFFINF